MITRILWKILKEKGAFILVAMLQLHGKKNLGFSKMPFNQNEENKSKKKNKKFSFSHLKTYFELSFSF